MHGRSVGGLGVPRGLLTAWAATVLLRTLDTGVEARLNRCFDGELTRSWREEEAVAAGGLMIYSRLSLALSNTPPRENGRTIGLTLEHGAARYTEAARPWRRERDLGVR